MDRLNIRILDLAARDPLFRSRSFDNLGAALAEEGFVLTDAQMAEIRDIWQALAGLPERAIYERISALARLGGAGG